MMATAPTAMAPELAVSAWLNTSAPLSLAALRGKVVAIHAFQMLCPGCVTHGVPQAQAIHTRFAKEGVVVIGLHSVFEHHAVMGREALEVFLHEYRINYPVAIDQPAPNGQVPMTMARYGLRGTPSLLLVDRAGRLRLNHFGQADDMRVGAIIGRLLEETDACEESGCRIG